MMMMMMMMMIIISPFGQCGCGRPFRGMVVNQITETSIHSSDTPEHDSVAIWKVMQA
jgi:hypothetical protein